MSANARTAASRTLRRRVPVSGVALIVATTFAPSVAVPARAETVGSDSSITVAWSTGDATVGPDASATPEQVAAAQPDHEALLSDGSGGDNGSGHWDDFEDLTVTVDQTTGLGDQAISVTVSGFTSETEYTLGGQLKSNFVQAMQCWGPNPNAADFYETCQFGAQDTTKAVTQVVDHWAASRGAADTPDPVSAGAVTRYPFRAVTNQFSQATAHVVPGDSQAVFYTTGLEKFFTTSTSNERVFELVDSTGVAEFDFQTQSASTQPYLGCGAAAGARCWLVIVPRGQHSGALPGGSAGDASQAGETCNAANNSGYGEIAFRQGGSPIAPDCSFFADRIVVPLDFAGTGSTCAAGSEERRAVGSEFIARAFSSWQRALCAESGVAYALNTNSGDLTRAQLLTGQTQLAILGRPVAANTIGSADAALLNDAAIVYAPLANTGMVIGFVFTEPAPWQEHTAIKLTPRLIAKLLTQSYELDIPWIAAAYGNSHSLSREQLSNPATLVSDPEWHALGNARSNDGGSAKMVLVGPQGDDAIALLWQYVLSDSDARAFLEGTPDPWGMTVNPYYLPAGSAGALGGGIDLLSTPRETFPKADQSLVPDAAVAATTYNGKQIDSTSFSPYSASFAANAFRVAEVDAQVMHEWDKEKVGGAWVDPGGGRLPTNSRFLTGPMTAADAAAYDLAAASIALPLDATTTRETVATARTFVTPGDATMAAAITSPGYNATGATATDFTGFANNAYPLTITLFAAANVHAKGLDDAARAEYAGLIRYAADAGQTRGDGPGQLPDGYVPLTTEQRAIAAAAVDSILNDRPPQLGQAASPSAQQPASPAAPPAAAPDISTSSTPVSAMETTAAVGGSPALGTGLLAALIGLAISPFLLRRRSHDV